MIDLEVSPGGWASVWVFRQASGTQSGFDLFRRDAVLNPAMARTKMSFILKSKKREAGILVRDNGGFWNIPGKALDGDLPILMGCIFRAWPCWFS